MSPAVTTLVERKTISMQAVADRTTAENMGSGISFKRGKAADGWRRAECL